MTSKKESLVLHKSTTILNFEDRLDHENGNGYILVARLYTSPNDIGKMHLESKNLEGKILTKAAGTAATTSNTASKHDTTDKINVDEK